MLIEFSQKHLYIIYKIDLKFTKKLYEQRKNSLSKES